MKNTMFCTLIMVMQKRSNASTGQLLVNNAYDSSILTYDSSILTMVTGRLLWRHRVSAKKMVSLLRHKGYGGQAGFSVQVSENIRLKSENFENMFLILYLSSKGLNLTTEGLTPET
jgi:hypothetical protein